MKKLVSLFLALVMILTALTASAATVVNNTNHEYDAYQVFKGTQATGDDTLGQIEWGSGVDSDALLTALKDDYNYFDSCTTAAHVAEVLADPTNQSAKATAFANTAAKHVDTASASITADDESSVNLDPGYYLLVDTQDVENATDARNTALLQVTNKGAITIDPKYSVPTVEKKVKDINDSFPNDTTDTTNNAWLDAADHDIGDDVSFKLTATLPNNLDDYDSYKLVFHDTLSDGLDFNNNVTVFMYANKTDAENDTNGTAVTTSFTTNTSATDGCSFEVSCNNILGITGVTKNSVFVVYYDAELNANAVHGAAGNPNTVYLQFSNNPYDTNATGKTNVDKVIVFTYQMVVNKVDSDGKALEGAGFILYKHNGTEYVQIGDEIVGGDMTTFTWNGLDDGKYKLVENTVPAGYNKMADIEFTITASHSETADAPVLISLNGGNMGTGVVDTGAITKPIVNQSGTVLPETGAAGTVMLISISSMFVFMAAIFMVTRKKMSVYED